MIAGERVGQGSLARGHLQPHAITSVQRRHYDGNDFLGEKRNALEMLLRVLELGNFPIRAQKCASMGKDAQTAQC